MSNLDEPQTGQVDLDIDQWFGEDFTTAPGTFDLDAVTLNIGTSPFKVIFSASPK